MYSTNHPNFSSSDFLECYADGRFYVRNANESDAVALTDTSALAEEAAPAERTRAGLDGRFAALLADLETASDKIARVTAFFAQTPACPWWGTLELDPDSHPKVMLALCACETAVFVA